jgi:hypothetical protein
MGTLRRLLRDKRGVGRDGFKIMETSMRSKMLAFIVSVVIGGLSSLETANANTFTVFDVMGSFTSDELLVPLPPTPIPLSGTLTVDVTIGSITAADLIIPHFSPLNITDSQFTSPNGTGLLYVLNLSDPAGDSGSIVFIYPLDQSDPLVGHNIVDIDQGEFTAASGLVVFGLTGDITATPEPATWTLMLVGFVGIGFACFRWTRRSAIL